MDATGGIVIPRVTRKGMKKVSTGVNEIKVPTMPAAKVCFQRATSGRTVLSDRPEE